MPAYCSVTETAKRLIDQCDAKLGRTTYMQEYLLFKWKSYSTMQRLRLSSFHEKNVIYTAKAIPFVLIGLNLDTSWI